MKNNDLSDKPKEIVDTTSIIDTKYNHFTVLAASSAVEVDYGIGKPRFTQNF